MTKNIEIPDIDVLSPPPRFCKKLIGHDKTINSFLSNLRVQKLHHAWLLSGIKGIGKASFAYQAAQFLLYHKDPYQIAKHPDVSLEISNNIQTKTLVQNNSHPDLLIIQRPWDDKTNKYKKKITAEETRRIKHFFSLKPALSHWRVCIIDSIDDMNITAANAILKSLEEPPKNTMLFLINHQSSKILDTIHSRCIEMPMQALKEDILLSLLEQYQHDISNTQRKAVVTLSQGSIGQTLQILETNALNIYEFIIDIIKHFPKIDKIALHKFSELLTPEKNHMDYVTFTNFFAYFLQRLIRAMATKTEPKIILEKEREIIQNMMKYETLEHWVHIWETITKQYQEERHLNLDRKHTIMQSFLKLSS